MALVPLERAHGGNTPVLILVSPTPVTALSGPEVDTHAFDTQLDEQLSRNEKRDDVSPQPPCGRWQDIRW